MFQPIRVFRSNIKPLLKGLIGITIPIWIAFIFMGSVPSPAEVLSNPKEGLLALSAPFIVYGVLFLFLLFLKWAFPITVYHNGIQCYNYYGVYQFIKWEEITNAYYKSVEGFKYVFIETQTSKSPITIPLYLDDMEDFIDLIRKKDSKGILASQYEAMYS